MNAPDLSVGQRLAIGSSIVALLILILGAVVAVYAARVADQQEAQTQLVAPRARAAVQLETAVYRQAVALRTYGLTGAAADRDVFSRANDELHRRMETLAGLPKSPEGQGIFDEIVAIQKSHQRLVNRYLELVGARADRETLRAMEAEASLERERLLERVESFAALQRQRTDAAAEEVSRAITNIFRVTVPLTLFLLLSSVLTGLIVARSVRLPAARLRHAAEEMRRGNFETALQLRRTDAGPGALPVRDELRDAGHVFGRMAQELKSREDLLAAHARLSAVLVTTLDPGEVATRSLREVAAYSGAEIGAVYLVTEDGRTLFPIATVALQGGLDPLPIGSGLPGEAAATRATTIVRDLPEDTPFLFRFGFDSAPPRCIVASPMIVHDRLVGVLLLGAVRDLPPEMIGFIEHSSGQLAISLDNALSHGRVAKLAGELQDRNENLQSTNEELQAQSEELQAQSEELQAQGEELQAQSEELQAQNEELTVLTGELETHTNELRDQQETLRKVNEELAGAEREKNRFLAVLGHELRNPLAAICSAVEVLQQSGPEIDSATDGVLSVVERQSAQLSRLLDDLLDVGRINSGKISLSRKPIEFSRIVERCISALPAAAAARVKASIGDAVWIDADATRIEQVVINLLTNALKFTPPEGRISLKLERDEAGALLTVTDTGAGIDAELLPRIFEFFVQGSARAGEANAGLGVGLALSKHLVDLHGGSIEAESGGPGHGTSVSVRLPTIDAATESPDTLLVSMAAAATESRSIVLVEDNPDLRMMMRLLLTRAGHQVHEGTDGPSGVEMVVRVTPDVALVDLDLPGFDGCEVARQLREKEHLNHVQLIAVSGYGRPEDRNRALEAGFDDHMVKPIDFERLRQLLLNAGSRRPTV
jgi:two-component system, sensor histidine kinase